MAQLSFHTLPRDLPDEIILRILQHWTEPQQLVVQDATVSEDVIHKVGDADRLHIIYACKSDEHARSSLPPYLFNEFLRLRQHAWLKDTKYFNNPYDFYVSHCILFDMSEHFPPLKLSSHSLAMKWQPPFVSAAHQPTNSTAPSLRKHNMVHISGLLLPQQPTPTHGLERITLDFSAAQYFALFDVRVPPFDRVPVDTNIHLYGAAILLQHCTHLTLMFGDKYSAQHPWYDLDDSVWDEAARLRPRVCDMGVCVDVVLEYAWGNGYIQNISKITLEGEHIQPWVREKWDKILEEWAVVKARGGKWRRVHLPNLTWTEEEEEEEENVGSAGAMAKWPPACTCKVSCCTLSAAVQGW